MADLAENLVKKTAQEYALILGLNNRTIDPAADLRPELAPCVLKGVKEFHDSVHSYDDEGKSQFISELVLEGMHDEQVWQQQEVQMTAVKRFLHEQFTVTNLEQLPLHFSKAPGKLPNGHSDIMETTDLGFAGEEEDDSDKESDGDDGGGGGGGDDDDDEEEEMDDEDSEDSDPELAEIKKRLKDNDGFGDFDGSDNDLFDGAQKEWDEENDDDDDEEDEDNKDENDFDFDLPSKKVEQKQKDSKQKAQKSQKRKSEVDDKFFKLSEMEEFLDREDAREERKGKRGEDNDDDDESEDEDGDEEAKKLDMFSSWSDEETGKESMYADFFDPPGNGDSSQQAGSMEWGSGEEFGDEGSEDEDNDSDEDEAHGSKKKVRFSPGTKEAKAGSSGEQSLSTFEKRKEKLSRQIQTLEEESLAAKPWQLKGEVGAGDRPENSMLEEHVDFRQAVPEAAEVTEELSRSIEDIILQRIKDKSCDDNVRQVRPVEEAFELKVQRTLDQEKSKLALHEVYEQEFLNMQAPEEEEKTNPVHDEIKKMMDHLFPRLDALASWHYTPLQSVPEVKVKNNLPSMRMEESTPITMSSASVLAPEEIQARRKGELKGKTERTKEDKQRERKQKKAAKREKMKEKEKRQKEVEKQNPGLGNKYSKQRALKQLEKEAKGTIEVIKDKQRKKSMSSQAFFTQLQEEVTTQTAAKSKVNKKQKKKSSDKLLL